jgi:hypothetical protein
MLISCCDPRTSFEGQNIWPLPQTVDSFFTNDTHISTCRTPNYDTWHEDCSSAPCPRYSVLQTGRHVWAPTTLGVQTDGGGAGPVHFKYAWGPRNIMPKRSRIKFSNPNMPRVHIRFYKSSLQTYNHLSHLEASMSIITVCTDHQLFHVYRPAVYAIKCSEWTGTTTNIVPAVSHLKSKNQTSKHLRFKFCFF